MSKVGKTLLGAAMLCATAATLASTTYAFVILEQEVNVEGFDFEIENKKGLLISIDEMPVTPTGTPEAQGNKKEDRNFYQNLPVDYVNKAILTATGKKQADQVKFTGVTLSDDGSGKIKFSPENGDPLFVKDSIVPSMDGETKYEGGDISSLAPGQKPMYGLHEMVETVQGDYLKLDFTLRIAEQGKGANTDEVFDLYFYNSGITSANGAVDVTLLNQFKLLQNKKETMFYSGNKLKVDPANAMRVGVLNKDADGDGKDDKSSFFKVIEQDANSDVSLGSVAIEENKGDNSVNDPNLNAMINYHNAVDPFSKFKKAAKNHEGFDTWKTFEDAGLTTNKIGTFKYDQSKQAYNDITLSIFIWLEGWDADYILGIPLEAQKMTVKLGFQMKKQEATE